MLSKQRPSREGSNPAWGSHPSLSSQELIQLALSAGNTTPTAENTPSHRGVSGYPLSHSFSSMPHDDVFYDSGMSTIFADRFMTFRCPLCPPYHASS